MTATKLRVHQHVMQAFMIGVKPTNEVHFYAAAHLLVFECWVEHISDDLQ